MERSVIPPPPRQIDGLQAIMKLRVRVGSEWGVFAYGLNKDIVGEDGKVDDFYGVCFHLGSFSDEKAASDHAIKIIERTGYSGVTIAKYGQPVPLTTNPSPSNSEIVYVDLKGKVIKMDNDEYNELRKEYEKKVKLEKEITKEMEEETDPDHIEHFKRMAYLCVKNRATLETHLHQAKEALENYNKRVKALRECYAKHPDFEEKFLPMLQDKLYHRGEEELYIRISEGYKKIRNELLPLDKIAEQLIDEHHSKRISELSINQ